MPCKDSYRQEIEGGRRRLDGEKKRRDSAPARFWLSLVDRVHHTPGGFGGLTAAEQIYFAVCILEGEVYNGGFDQYFSNNSADYYGRAADGLKELGARQSLRLLLEAKEILFGENPLPTTQTDRIVVFPGISTHAALQGWSDRLNELDRRFNEDPDGLGERIDRFAAKHGLPIDS